VPQSDVTDKYKRVVASLFNPRALFYFKTKGLDTTEMMMPVGVLEMIDSKVSGVGYSRDPNNPSEEAILISAAEGLGKAVVDGTVTPDIYKVKRTDTSEVIDRCISCQEKALSCSPNGGVCELQLDGSRTVPLLGDDKLKELADAILALERHFGSPQDVEWTVDKNNTLYILQSRPLRINIDRAKPIPRKIEGYKLLITKGSIAHKGIGFGKAFIVKSDEDLKDFPENGVLVAKHTSTKFVTVMKKANAIVTDIGSTTGHMASLAREYEVPTILGTGEATLLIKNGQDITVDAYNCNVYDGIVEELKEFQGKKDFVFMETSIYKKLKEVLKWTVPLKLTDPDSDQFRAANCETLHDITRYCHEMVVRELFDVEYTSADEVGAKKLVAGIPVEIAVLDLGDAIEGNPKYLNPEHLRSIPFNAFLKGLMGMKWPEARDFDISGFMGAIAHTATVTEEEILRTAEKSFAFISPNFMSFAIRLGYHFSSIESFAGDNLNDNYIKFFFKKGGTVVERRLRRVRLITTILREMNFTVNVKDDVINAQLVKYPLKEITKRLEILGKLTVYTKQLDMVLINDAVTNQYIEDFCEEYVYHEINQPSPPS
ncbi:MAG: PEP/pyruvate-binding domain-containing protein, partial [Thermodesulfovibrionales bacterium]